MPNFSARAQSTVQRLDQEMATTDPITIEEELESIRMLSGDDLAARYQELPSDQLPGPEFFSRLKASETKIVQKCCLLLSAATKGKKLPRLFQLEATLAVLSGRDSLINAGTGSGKTICMILPALLDPTSVALVVSPLKRLQILQVSVGVAFRAC